MRRTASASVALGAMSFCFVSGPSHAADLNGPPGVHVAAAGFGDDSTRNSKLLVLGHGQRELEWWLAQNLPLKPAEGSGATILAGFPLSSPETTEEDVAKQHGLEVVRRFTLESLNRRIVVLRIPDARAATDVVAALTADQRVSSAQVNARYELPAQRPQEREIGERKQSPDPNAKQDQKQASPPAGKIALPTKPQTKAADRLNAPQATRTAAPIPSVTRSRQQGSLVTRNHAGLRWPTADEPFVNVGMTNK